MAIFGLDVPLIGGVRNWSEKWNQKRKINRRSFFITAVVGLIFLIDIPFPPIPMRLSLILFLISVAVSYWFYDKGWALPTPRMLMLIAEKYQGHLTHAIVLHHLDIPAIKVSAILNSLWEKGLIEIINRPPREEGEDPNMSEEDRFRKWGVRNWILKWPGAQGQRAVSDGQSPQTAADLSLNQDLSAADINRALLGGTLDLQGAVPGESDNG